MYASCIIRFSESHETPSIVDLRVGTAKGPLTILASRSAFAGGVTTIGNFISQEPGVTAEATLSEAMDVAKRQAMADVILHYTASDPTTLNQADIDTLRDRQVTLKIFMVRPAFDQNAAGNVNLIRVERAFLNLPGVGGDRVADHHDPPRRGGSRGWAGLESGGQRPIGTPAVLAEALTTESGD